MAVQTELNLTNEVYSLYCNTSVLSAVSSLYCWDPDVKLSTNLSFVYQYVIYELAGNFNYVFNYWCHVRTRK